MMGFYYYFFNGFGVVCVLLLSLVVLFVLLLRVTRGEKKAVKIALCLLGFLAVQTVAIAVLLNDYAEPPNVDISPLREIGGARVSDFAERQATLEETRFFIKKNKYAYNYRFQYYDRPTADLTIYPLRNTDEAYQNLLRLPGVREDDVRQLSESVFVYVTDAKMRRMRNGFFFEDLSRRVETYFVVDNLLFSLREYGDAAQIGQTSGEVIALLCDTFLGARPARTT